jgi:ABC-type dipeptide/oligopeptide/nickel transport system permease component
VGVFIVRRIIISFFTLVAATFIVYALVANAGDPLAPLYEIPDQNRQDLAVAARTELLNLDQPFFTRYLGWLTAAAGCLVGSCDLGRSITQQDVATLTLQAMGSTLRLVIAATVVAILFGVTIGIISALRQYTGFDYVVTFFAFLFFSLPIFWVAVLLKEFGAIKVNGWLKDPTIPLASSSGSPSSQPWRGRRSWAGADDGGWSWRSSPQPPRPPCSCTCRSRSGSPAPLWGPCWSSSSASAGPSASRSSWQGCATGASSTPPWPRPR